MSKVLIERFRDEKSDEELMGQIGKIKQRKVSIHQFVPCGGNQRPYQTIIVEAVISSPLGHKSLRASFLNGNSLKGMAK